MWRLSSDALMETFVELKFLNMFNMINFTNDVW